MSNERESHKINIIATVAADGWDFVVTRKMYLDEEYGGRGYSIRCDVRMVTPVKLLSCVRDSVTKNNGFWIGRLDLLALLL
jgi:hypothetical protein